MPALQIDWRSLNTSICTSIKRVPRRQGLTQPTIISSEICLFCTSQIVQLVKARVDVQKYGAAFTTNITPNPLSIVQTRLLDVDLKDLFNQ